MCAPPSCPHPPSPEPTCASTTSRSASSCWPPLLPRPPPPCCSTAAAAAQRAQAPGRVVGPPAPRRGRWGMRVGVRAGTSCPARLCWRAPRPGWGPRCLRGARMLRDRRRCHGAGFRGAGRPPPGPPGAENGFLLLMSSCRKSVGSGVQGSGFRVQGCRVQGSGFRVQGSGCMVQHKRGDRVPGMAARAEGVPERRLMRSVFESGDFVKFQTHAEASWMLQTFTENPGGWTYDPGNTCYVFGAPNYLNNIIK